MRGFLAAGDAPLADRPVTRAHRPAFPWRALLNGTDGGGRTVREVEGRVAPQGRARDEACTAAWPDLACPPPATPAAPNCSPHASSTSRGRARGSPYGRRGGDGQRPQPGIDRPSSGRALRLVRPERGRVDRSPFPLATPCGCRRRFLSSAQHGIDTDLQTSGSACPGHLDCIRRRHVTLAGPERPKIDGKL